MKDPFEPFMGYGIRRLPDGSILLPRKNKEVEAKLDSAFIRTSPNERKWVPKAEDFRDIEEITDRFKHQCCYIIGKGPSLDSLSVDDFPNSLTPIIAINEAIHAVEKLYLSNPTFLNMGDTHIDCRPTRSTTELLLMRQVGNLYPGHERYIYSQVQLSSKTLGIVRAARVAEMMGCSDIVFLCCDAAVTGECDYADSVGYDSSKGGPKARFLEHRSIVEGEVTIPMKWILPKSFNIKEEDLE